MDFHFEETLLYVENLSVAYDEHIIIKDINIVEKNVIRKNHDSTGQVIAVVGRSGRGKSTLFKALTGLVSCASGKILIRDFSKPELDAAKPVKEGDIGFVDQKYTLFRNKTVSQALKYALRNSSLSDAEKKDKINDYVARWGLEKCVDKYPNELSGGQRQRTAIIEQLFSSDTYIVMDEPFSGLDVGNIDEVRKNFNMLVEENEHNTILFSTHDIKLAVELAQSLYIVGHPTVEGKMQNHGTIVGRYDFREMGLAWKEYGEAHLDVYNDIVQKMMIS